MNCEKNSKSHSFTQMSIDFISGFVGGVANIISAQPLE